MRQISRRKVFRFGVGAAALLLIGCGGSEQDSSAASAPAPAPAAPPPPAPSTPSASWTVNPPSFAVGSGAAFNLAMTLPQGTGRGGVFGVSATGAGLPAGMTLTPVGILSVGTASVGSVSGVIFTYASP